MATAASPHHLLRNYCSWCHVKTKDIHQILANESILVLNISTRCARERHGFPPMLFSSLQSGFLGNRALHTQPRPRWLNTICPRTADNGTMCVMVGLVHLSASAGSFSTLKHFTTLQSPSWNPLLCSKAPDSLFDSPSVHRDCWSRLVGQKQSASPQRERAVVIVST